HLDLQEQCLADSIGHVLIEGTDDAGPVKTDAKCIAAETNAVVDLFRRNFGELSLSCQRGKDKHRCRKKLAHGLESFSKKGRGLKAPSILIFCQLTAWAA